VLRGSIGCCIAKGRIAKILEGPGVPSHVPQRWKGVLSIYSTVVGAENELRKTQDANKQRATPEILNVSNT